MATRNTKIYQWGFSRGLFNSPPNMINEYDMIKSELSELLDAIRIDDVDEMIDALNDISVLCAGATYKLGYCADLTMDETIKEINSRKQDPEQAKIWGTVSGEKWRKWREQPKDTLYKANYSKCKLGKI